MDMSEYLDAVTEQIRCKRVRNMVATELRNHIEDQQEAYIATGMDKSQAEKEAVRQMGDAITVGMELDRIHRPRLDKKTLILMAVISLLGIIMQGTVFRLWRLDSALSGDVTDVVFQVLLGVAIMCGILFADYTFIGKYPFALWFGMLLIHILTIADFGSPFGNVFSYHYFMQRLCILCLFGIMLPAYVGLIYHYRKKGWKGLLLSLGWLLLGSFLAHRASGRLLYCLVAFLSCFLLLTYAIAKGWFSIAKRKGLTVIWGSLLGSIICFCAVIFQENGYRSARLKALFENGKFILWRSEPLSPDRDYISIHIRNSLNNIHIFGKNTSLPDMPKEGALSFFLLINEYGSIVGILMTAVLLLLFFFMLQGILRQKNILGKLLGIACLLGMLLPSVVHIFSNLSMLVYSDMYLPFFYPGYVANASCYGLIGIYLSVYRYTDVVA